MIHLQIGPQGPIIKAYVATTELELTTGLSKFDYLPENEGMLLVLPAAGQVSIDMRRMRFPVDVLFLTDQLRVKGITRNLKPGFVYGAPCLWRFALELNVGESRIDALGKYVAISSSPESQLYDDQPLP